MLKILTLVILLVAFSSLRAEDLSTDEVHQFFAELTYSLNVRDLDAIGNAWKERGELISLAGGIFKGRQEIRNFFNEAFLGPYKEAKFHHFIQYIRFEGDTRATVDGVWKISNGGPANYPVCGIFLYTLSKVSGAWRLEMAYSSVPRPGHTSEHGRTLSWKEICKSGQ